MDGKIISRGERNICGDIVIEHIERVSVKVSADPAKGTQGLLRNPVKCKTDGYLVTLWICRTTGGRYGVYDGGDTDIDFFASCPMLHFPRRVCRDADSAVAAYIERLTIMEQDNDAK